jgi:hypothetical protein
MPVGVSMVGIERLGMFEHAVGSVEQLARDRSDDDHPSLAAAVQPLGKHAQQRVATHRHHRRQVHRSAQTRVADFTQMTVTVHRIAGLPLGRLQSGVGGHLPGAAPPGRGGQLRQQFPGVERSHALQAGREIRVLVEPSKISDGEAMQLARNLTKKIEAELQYPGQIKVTVVRETRVVEYAK